MTTLKEILLPDIGDFPEVEVIEVLVAPGDRITAGQSIITVESDKASTEIPSSDDGTIAEVIAQVGDKVHQGSLLLRLEATSTEPAAEPRADTPPQEAASAPASDPAPAAAETPAPGATRSQEQESISVVLPDIGDFSDVPVIELLVAPGDHIDVDQSIVTLESDKATMEIPAPQAGVVEGLAVAVGDTVNAGDLLLTLYPDSQEEDATPQPAPAAVPASAPAAPPPAPAEPVPGESARRKPPVLPRPEELASLSRNTRAHASPAVRRFARELGVDLSQVKGSGPKGRIVKEDVQGFIKKALSGSAPTAGAAQPFALPAAPAVDFSRFGEIEYADLPRIRKISGKHLHQCWLSIPHVTQFDEVDITELEAFRKSLKKESEQAQVRLTMLAFLLKAVAAALEQMPHLKASLTPDGEQLVLKRYTHIGVAVDTPNGLVVPVLRDVDKKGIYALASELGELSARARDGKLLPGDMQGGCFTISSLGGIGGTAFTPIINAPEVAILGVSRASMKPVWNGQEFMPRLMLPLSLSYDHRVVDGAEGARFITRLGTLLQDIRRLLL